MKLMKAIFTTVQKVLRTPPIVVMTPWIDVGFARTTSMEEGLL